VDTSDRLCNASPSKPTDPVTKATANSTAPVNANPTADQPIAPIAAARSATSTDGSRGASTTDDNRCDTTGW
jgi:hypothetical protein